MVCQCCRASYNVTSDNAARQDSMNVLMYVCPHTTYSSDVPVVLGTNVLMYVCPHTTYSSDVPVVLGTNVLMYVCPHTTYSSDVPVVLGTNVLSTLCDDQVDSTVRGNAELAQVLSSFQAIESLRNCRDEHVGEVRVCSRRAVIIPPGKLFVCAEDAMLGDSVNRIRRLQRE